MTYQIEPGPWESYADEAGHYSCVRCIEPEAVYEAVRVTHEKDGQQAEFLYQVFFLAEFDEPALDEILQGSGYKDLDAYVSDLNQSGFVIQPARKKGPARYIDYMYLASLMAEHFDGRRMSVRTADQLARVAVGNQMASENPEYGCEEGAHGG